MLIDTTSRGVIEPIWKTLEKQAKKGAQREFTGSESHVERKKHGKIWINQKILEKR